MKVRENVKGVIEMEPKIRINLKEKGGNDRFCFSAKFEKYGFKYTDRSKTHAQPTLLLKDVMDEERNLLTDHLWFNLTKGFKTLGILHVGDVLRFNGRVKSYQKGYQGHQPGISRTLTIDYKIDRPTKVQLKDCCNDQKIHQTFLGENWQVCNQIYDMYQADYQSRGIPVPYSSYF